MAAADVNQHRYGINAMLFEMCRQDLENQAIRVSPEALRLLVKKYTTYRIPQLPLDAMRVYWAIRHTVNTSGLKLRDDRKYTE